jgi:uncharacterized membrane protein YhaH (DUF805 family)
MVRKLLHLMSFRGRASRREYAGVFVVTIAGNLAAGIVSYEAPNAILAWSLFALALLFFYGFLAVSARRLHDLGKSAWLLLLWPIPMVGLVLIAWSFLRPSAPSAA